ncbi:MAG: trimeric intracellular cation channel family protein, partial [Cytophagaceae bacterium]
MDFLRILDVLGTAAFAVSGVMAAREKKLDIFGIFIIAFITALGGGTVRDVLIGDTPVSWMVHPENATAVLVATVITLLFTGIINNLQKTLLLFDSLGLGLFTIFGLQKGLAFGLHPAICVAIGTITACFGGVIRDVLLNKIPLIFQKEIYATACIFGGVLYFILLNTPVPNIPSDL